MSTRIILSLVGVTLAIAAGVVAPLAGQPIPAGMKVGVGAYLGAAYGGLKADLLAAAAAMPEADYRFKPGPAPEMRTYGQVLAHVAEGQSDTCASIAGAPPRRPQPAPPEATKAQVEKVLAESFALCDEVFASLTDTNAADLVPVGKGHVARSALMTGILAHGSQMYGIATVYLRARGLVPPSTARQQPAAAAPAVPSGVTRLALETARGLRLHNVTATPATHDGRKGLRVVLSDAAMQRLAATTPEQREAANKASQFEEQLAVVEGVTFGNGTIEAEIAGAPRAGAGEGARGFVGLAFRVSEDLKTYEAFYLRPTNGRAEDQVRRNHSAQYISHPMWPWFRLRADFPEKYESYVDVVPNAWTKVKIEVRGAQARLFVHDQPQPTLIVNDLKTGAGARGGVALWIETSTDAHFRNLTVTPAP